MIPAIIPAVVAAIVTRMERPGREIRVESGIAVAAPRTVSPPRTKADRQREAGTVSTVSESGAAIAPIPARIVHAYAIEWIVELGEIAAVRIRLVRVPIIAGLIIVLIDSAVIIVFGDDHITVPLIVGFHAGEPLWIGVEGRDLGIAPREHGSRQQENHERTQAGQPA